MAAVVCALGVAMFAPGAAPAATVQFAATIDGAQETPPTFTGAMATGTFTMDTSANTLAINVVITVPPPSGETAAHIHGFAGPGVPAGILFGLAVGSPKIAVWNFSEPQEANIIAGLTYVNIHSSAFPGGEIRGQIVRVPSCGDGILDGGETCDDGNTDNDDCCSSSCQYDAPGTACEGSNLCGAGECDGAGACEAEIRTNCRSAGKSILLMKNPGGDTSDKMVWKWLKGDMTDLADFGDPTTTTEYALCVYSGTSAATIWDAEIAPSPTLWGAAGTTGLKYKDANGLSDGIRKVILKSGAQGKAKALVKGKGGDLPDLPVGPLTPPITAHLVNSANAVCFEGVYDTLDVIKNDTVQFKAKAQ